MGTSTDSEKLIELLLQSCTALDIIARDVYHNFAEQTESPRLRALFAQLSVEEADHVRWWGELLRRHGRGELELSVAVSQGTAEYMQAVVSHLQASAPERFDRMNDTQRLAFAASMEFFSLDPAFSLFITVSDQDAGEMHRAEYDQHVQLLAETLCEFEAFELKSQAALLGSAESEFAHPRALVTRDSLTGLPTAALLRSALEPLCDPVLGGDFSIVVVDIDDLSAINKSHGRKAGDAVLAKVSLALASLSRPTDTLWRLNDDSFAIVLPDVSSSRAAEVARACVDVCQGVASSTIPNAGECVSVSAVMITATATSGSPIDLGGVLGCVLRATAARGDAAESGNRGIVATVHCD
jgi:diguanylate cyclase (GGDEF)-like protein